MNWFKKIFKRPQTNTNIPLHPVEYLIKDHLSRIESQFKHQQNHETFKTRCFKVNPIVKTTNQGKQGG